MPAHRMLWAMSTLIGVVGVAIGALMIGQWATALARGSVPELRTRPAEIRLHLAAEFATAAVLIAGGLLTIGGMSVGSPLLLFAMGMLAYTAVVSPGYFLDRGERGPVAMFAVIVLIALGSAAWIIVDLAR